MRVSSESPRRPTSSAFRLALVFLATLPLVGCGAVALSPKGRAATDQYLSSRTIEDALARMEIADRVAGVPVSLDVRGNESADLEYFKSALEAKLRLDGAEIVSAPAEGEPTPDATVLRVMVQSLGSDTRVGKWEIPVALPTLESVFTVSRLAIWKSESQIARCHFWTFALNSDGEVLYRIPAVSRTHHVTHRELLGITLGRSTDLKELRPNFGIPSLRRPDEPPRLDGSEDRPSGRGGDL